MKNKLYKLINPKQSSKICFATFLSLSIFLALIILPPMSQAATDSKLSLGAVDLAEFIIAPDGGIHLLEGEDSFAVLFNYLFPINNRPQSVGTVLFQNDEPVDGVIVEGAIMSGYPNEPTVTGYLIITGLGHFTPSDNFMLEIFNPDGTSQKIGFDFYQLTRGRSRVDFVDHDGSLLLAQLVQSFETVTAPPNPSRYGYTFTGWDKTFDDYVYEDLTIQAQYMPDPYTVTFYANSKPGFAVTGPSQLSKVVVFDSEYGVLASVSMAHYDFLGWFTEPVGGNEVTDVTVLELAEDHTLYAQWAPTAYTIAYDLTGGVNGNGNPVSYTVEDLPIALSNPVWDRTFLGWTIIYANGASEALVSGVIPENVRGDLKLVARWSAKHPPVNVVTVNGVEISFEVVNGVTVLTPSFDQMSTILNAAVRDVVFDLQGQASVDLYVGASWFKNVDKTIIIKTDNGDFSVSTKQLWNNSGKTRLITVNNGKLSIKNI